MWQLVILLHQQHLRSVLVVVYCCRTYSQDVFMYLQARTHTHTCCAMVSCSYFLIWPLSLQIMSTNRMWHLRQAWGSQYLFLQSLKSCCWSGIRACELQDIWSTNLQNQNQVLIYEHYDRFIWPWVITAVMWLRASYGTG